jgi:hypothetical protein
MVSLLVFMLIGSLSGTTADRPTCIKRVTWDVGQKLEGCQFSPDSRHFACMAGNHDTTSLVVWNVNSDKPVHTWEMPQRAFPEYFYLNVRAQEEVYSVQFISPTQIVVSAARRENLNEFTFYAAVANLQDKSLTHHQFKLTPPCKYTTCSFLFATHAPIMLAFIPSPDAGPNLSSQRGGYWIKVNTLTGTVEKTGYLDEAFPKHYGFNEPILSPDGVWLMVKASANAREMRLRHLTGLLLNVKNGQHGPDVVFKKSERSYEQVRGRFSSDGKKAYWQEQDVIQSVALENQGTVQVWNAPTIKALPDGTRPDRRWLPLNGFGRVVEYTDIHSRHAALQARRPVADQEGSGPDQDGVPAGWSVWRKGATEALFLPLHWYNGVNMLVISPDGQYLAQLKWMKKQPRKWERMVHFALYQVK